MPTYKVVAYLVDENITPTRTSNNVHAIHGSSALAPAPEPEARPRPTAVPQREVLTRRGASEQDVEDQLIADGYKIASITTIEKVASWKTKFRAEKIRLYSHLSRALRKKTYSRQDLVKNFLPMFAPTSKFRDYARAFLASIVTQDIYRAMASQPEVFADYEVNILEIGADGKEPHMLDMLAKSLKLENKVSRWGTQLLVYPAILTAFMGVAIFAYYTQMLPKLLSNTRLAADETYPLYMQIIMLPYTLYSSWTFGTLTTLTLALIIGVSILAYILSPKIQYAVEFVILKWTGPYGLILVTGLQIRIFSILRLLLANGQQDSAYSILRGAAVGRLATGALQAIYKASREGQVTWAHALYKGEHLFDQPLVSRIISAETIGAVTGMTEELGEILEEKEEDGEILFEDLKTKLNASAILVFGAVLLLLYLSLYLPVRFFITHAS